jgi:Ca2+-transporting ATPase
VEPYRLTVDEVARALGTDIGRGLDESTARARLARDGANQLTSTPPIPAWQRLLKQFHDTLVILLLAATAISVALWIYERETALPYEALAIFAIVLINAVMGYLQESRAETAVAALRATSAAEATVIRDGNRQRIAASAIVVGDLILIEEGDTIPADGRLVQSVALQAAEAALTGESLPLTKDTAKIDKAVPLGDQDNMVFSGTAATYGRGMAIATATGMRTELGRIAVLLRDTPDEKTPLQLELDRTGRRLGAVVIAIAIAMVAAIMLVEDVRRLSAFLDVLIVGVALAVAAVPEGLPAIVTAVLAVGVQRMARRHAIVRHLATVETLGSASVIASDKTGTLTKNEMTVRLVVTASGRAEFGGSGYSPDGEVRREGGGGIDAAMHAELARALTVAERASNAQVRQIAGRWIVQGDPTEGALIVAARKAGLADAALKDCLPRIGELPFSSERKLMTTIHRDADQPSRAVVFTKGAPGVLLGRCTQEYVGGQTQPLTAERRAEILTNNDGLAGAALRTLAVAERRLAAMPETLDARGFDADIEHDLVFVGLIGMIDPPRAEAKQAVARARRAGIRPIMITGDHPLTASVIARELGISDDGRAITGAQFEALSEDEVVRTVTEVSVYARVNPEDKLRIIDALRRAGAVVAMTGDGVNDAPALKKADIGIAMGITGTDVAKEAADMILADDNFASIVAAVEEGRAIFANIRKFLRYLLSSNIGEVLTMFGGVLLAKQLGLHVGEGVVVLPLLATQILWINLVTDGPPALALGMDPADERSMHRPPRPIAEGVLTARMWRGILFVGAIMAAGTLLVFDASLPGGFIEGTGNLRYAQTMAFTTLVLFQMFNVVNARSDVQSAFVRLFTNGWLWAAFAGSVGLQMVVVYVPVLQHAFGTQALSGPDWSRCLAVASSVLWLREISKLFERRVESRKLQVVRGGGRASTRP